MAANSSATGTTSALFDAAAQIARLPDVDATKLTLLEGVLLLLYGRDKLVSIHSARPLTENDLSSQRLEALFLTLAGAGVLKRQHRDRRGAAYDQYQLDTNRLHEVLQDAILLKQAHDQFQVETSPTDPTQLIATLPESLPLPSEVRRSVSSIAATLHRLITNATQDIVILNPFFEQEGFSRLASALLAAAGRGVSVTIITRQLSDATAVNHRVIRQLWEESQDQGVANRFRYYEYQQIEGGQIVLTSHAKVMLVDASCAYLGSANLTEYGMARFLEIGVCVCGSSAQTLQQILLAIIRAKETVRREGFD